MWYLVKIYNLKIYNDVFCVHLDWMPLMFPPLCLLFLFKWTATALRTTGRSDFEKPSVSLCHGYSFPSMKFSLNANTVSLQSSYTCKRFGQTHITIKIPARTSDMFQNAWWGWELGHNSSSARAQGATTDAWWPPQFDPLYTHLFGQRE